MADLSQEAWASQLKEDTQSVVLDVRTLDEVSEGDIFMGQSFLDGLEKLDKSKNYFVYCRSGNRSGQACAIMQSVGFETAHNLVGGFMEWTGDTDAL
jgi:rhodanese-related sulfurtransferase